jgi:hypothetical protein
MGASRLRRFSLLLKSRPPYNVGLTHYTVPFLALLEEGFNLKLMDLGRSNLTGIFNRGILWKIVSDVIKESI